MPQVDNAGAADGGVRLAAEPLARRLTFSHGLDKDANTGELDGTDFQRASVHETSQQGISVSTQQQKYKSDRRQWPARALSIILCIMVASMIALFFSFVYLVLKGKDVL